MVSTILDASSAHAAAVAAAPAGRDIAAQLARLLVKEPPCGLLGSPPMLVVYGDGEDNEGIFRFYWGAVLPLAALARVHFAVCFGPNGAAIS